MARQRVNVNQAAELLGTSTDAVRKRARRGTLDSEKDADGHLYIWLDGGAPSGSTPTQAHVDSLEDQIEFLRGELERKDHLLAAALERIPAIEAPEAPESAEPHSDRGTTPEEQQEPTWQPWWRRWFGT